MGEHKKEKSNEQGKPIKFRIAREQMKERLEKEWHILQARSRIRKWKENPSLFLPQPPVEPYVHTRVCVVTLSPFESLIAFLSVTRSTHFLSLCLSLSLSHKS